MWLSFFACCMSHSMYNNAIQSISWWNGFCDCQKVLRMSPSVTSSHQFKATGVKSLCGFRGVTWSSALSFCWTILWRTPGSWETNNLSIVGLKSPVYCQSTTLDHRENRLFGAWSGTQKCTVWDGLFVNALTMKCYFKQSIVREFSMSSYK